MRQIFTSAMLGFACLCGFTFATKAQSAETNWPMRPVTMVVAYPPRAIADTVGRRVAERLSQALRASRVQMENLNG